MSENEREAGSVTAGTWNILIRICSLSGRERARAAWFVTIFHSPDPGHQCL